MPRLPSLLLLPSPQPYIPLAASAGVQSPDLRRDPGEERKALMPLQMPVLGWDAEPRYHPAHPRQTQRRNKEHPLLLHSQIFVPAPLL